jgi:hypothetical protein
MSEQKERKLWFYAKQYGWGWGLPACWQGWVVFYAYIALAVGGVFAIALTLGLIAYLIFLGVLTGLLFVVCWLKGEKLAWRWGGPTTVASTSKVDLRPLLLIHLLFGPLLLGGALYYRTHLPTEINSSYGFRTELSMKSQEAWDEAQRFGANAMIVAALATIAYQAAIYFATRRLGELAGPFLSLYTSGIVLVAALLIAVAITESHLKKHFDAEGKRIAVPSANR